MGKPTDPGRFFGDARNQSADAAVASNVRQAVPFFNVTDIEASLHRDLISRGVAAERPFVGNGLWVTSVRDPDGYRLEFKSPTDLPEETVFSERGGG